MAENAISKALRVIVEELPKFATEMGVPFFGKDEDRSVMKPISSKQIEKTLTETLLTASLGALPIMKAAKFAVKNPVIPGVAATAVTNDPSNLIPGKAGLAMLQGVGDAEAAFIGPKAKTWEAMLAKTAENMLDVLKKDPKKVHELTGTARGLDGELKQEISDAGMKLKVDQTGRIYIDHPEVVKAYPQFANDLRRLVEIRIDPSLPTDKIGGAFYPLSGHIEVDARSEAEAKRFAAHEVQHKVDMEEGWQSGGSPDMKAKPVDTPVMQEVLKYYYEDLAKAADLEKAGKGIPPELTEQLAHKEALLNEFGMLDGTLGNSRYWRLKAEAGARVTEKRQAMTDEERMEDYPWSDRNLDVRKDMLLNFDDVKL